MADDDLFGSLFADLCPPPESSEPAQQPMRPRGVESVDNGTSEPATSPPAPAAAPRGDLLQSGMYVMLKEDARDHIHEAVKASVEDAVKLSVGKLVNGVRDVLVSITKRMETVEAEVDGMKQAVAKADMESVQLQIDTRFTAVDEALRGLGRSVQAMRDHAELVEAQTQLSRLQPGATKIKGNKTKKKSAKPKDSDSGTDDDVIAQQVPANGSASQEAPGAARAPTLPSISTQSAAEAPAQSTQQHAPQQAAPPQPQPHQSSAVPTAPPATPTHAYGAAAPYQGPHASPHQPGPPQQQQPPQPQPQPYAPQATQPGHQYSASLGSNAPNSYQQPAPYAQQPPPPQQQQQPQQPQQPSYAQPHGAYAASAAQGGYSATAQPHGSGVTSYPTYGAPAAGGGGAGGAYMGYPQASAPPGGGAMSRGYSTSSDYASRYGAPSPAPAQQPRAADNKGPSTRSTEQVIADIMAIGFERWKVERVLAAMSAEGKPIDLNEAVDKLMSESQR